jgi:hypothetical protein
MLPFMEILMGKITVYSTTFFGVEYAINTKNQTNSGASVHQRTIPTERPPLVGEVSANFRG